MKGLNWQKNSTKQKKTSDHISARNPLIAIKENNLTKTDVPNHISKRNPPLAIKEK